MLAVRCPRGHLTDPLSAVCRACGDPVPPQEPSRVLRPPLGVLRLPDGDRSCPRPARGAGPAARRRPARATGPTWCGCRTTRRTCRGSTCGSTSTAGTWSPQDLGSRGGTTLFAPGRDPEKIRGHEPHLLENGTTLDLAGVYQVTYLPLDGEDAT